MEPSYSSSDLPRNNTKYYFPEIAPDVLKGDWILPTEDADGTFSLCMYSFRTTQYSLQTQLSSLAILFGKTIDAEVLSSSVKLFISQTTTAEVFMQFSGVIQITCAQLRSLKAFHLTLTSILFRVVELGSGTWDKSKAYLFAPVSNTTTEIDWHLLYRVTSSEKIEKHHGPPDFHHGTDAYVRQKHPSNSKESRDQLHTFDECIDKNEIAGRVITTVHNGRRFYVEKILEMTAESSFTSRSGQQISYVDYYLQRYGVNLSYPNQPMVGIRGTPKCKNFLSPCFMKEKKMKLMTFKVALPLELCIVHPLPGSLLRGAQYLPSFMKRIESLLLAAQLKHDIGFPISSSKVLEALTPESCQEHMNYERAELLGDAVLKWIVSTRLYVMHPAQPESQLGKMRQEIVSNCTLSQKALSRNLHKYIPLVDRFMPSNNWTVPGIPLKGLRTRGEAEARDEPKNEQLSGSSRVIYGMMLADIVEALIGVYYVEGGVEGAVHIMKWIGIPVDCDLSEAKRARAGCEIPENVLRSAAIESLQRIMGYSFKSRSLLVEAITHPSTGGDFCYQRLEFLGDAIMDHLITRYVFFRFGPDLTPEDLSNLRAASVNNERFARMSIRHKFHLFLRHGSDPLVTQIHDFTQSIQTEPDKPGIHSYGIGHVKAPKVLGDIFESIAGAVFVDTGFNVNEVWKVFESFLQPMITPETLRLHPAKQLEMRCLEREEYLEHKTSIYGNSATVEVFIDGVLVCSATNSCLKTARKLASQTALEHLEEQDKVLGPKSKVQLVNLKNLYDVCKKRAWRLPEYILLRETESSLASRFKYAVRVNTESGRAEEGVGEAMPSKKKAKNSAALALLENLKESGLL